MDQSVDTVDIYGNVSLNDGNWHHLAFAIIYNGISKLYVDGQLVASDGTNWTGAPDITSGPLTIGAWSNSTGSSITEVFNGVIDEPRVYSCALSQAEIAAIYGGTK